MKIFKKLLSIVLIISILIISFIFWANYSIKKESEAFVSYTIADVPKTKTALLLGTGKTLSNGMPNAYFYNRIKAATDLYKSGKIQYIIVSGDNSTKDYNEPEDMLLTLMHQGIPQDKIIMDHAGFRTLDSVVRAKDIFGQTKLVIISQKFHNERAVFLARKNGMEAFGYNAADVNKYVGLKTNMREYIAKAKVYWDLLFGVEPKFGGEKILIP
ncbi:vancomycin high temperature exclusion protein [Chryseobacterium sp. YR221]|uniref:SanA/YdcF family protein n=1 Tax=Chryseobacterium sp. YR221 TaxID=1500293 RepID=UPI0009D7F047|nr:ElyC/SanA/YdcF family protein [Chryseobacterium sp. YR221]SMC93432.1 SanA protein [Chryseobacterium sp. YR221]